MFNVNSPIVQNMINTGQFGYSQPMNYNPYQNNNIIPISQTGYNQPTQFNNTGGYIFSPIKQNYNYYNNNQNYDYYNPYGNQFNNNQYNYYNPYGSNGYYNSFVSPSILKRQQDEHNSLMKIKIKASNNYLGINMQENKIDEIIDPRNRKLTDEERLRNAEFDECVYYERLFSMPHQETDAERAARILYNMSYNFHKHFDNHSLFTFLEQDLWKLQREYWIMDNIKNANRRDLSGTYSSREYNELLDMHRSSNPYINELLDTSRFDNNLDDMEIGLPVTEAFNREARRRAILEGRVPSFISSDEVQKRRNEWTNQILNQIYNKNGNEVMNNV